MQGKDMSYGMVFVRTYVNHWYTQHGMNLPFQRTVAKRLRNDWQQQLYWPPHTKFHNAQTMVFGALLGLLSLWALWGRKTVQRQKNSIRERY